MAVAQPDGAPNQVAADFFPNFATVRSALEAGRIGVWSWNIATNVVTWSSNMEAIHGLPPGYESIKAGEQLADWTYGCIGLTNPEMDEVWRLVPNGTPIEILH